MPPVPFSALPIGSSITGAILDADSRLSIVEAILGVNRERTDFRAPGIPIPEPEPHPLLPRKEAHGGPIPHTAGIDTVPTMLSGGEFVMNAAATQNIGRGNLATMNAGGGGDDSAVVARLDELIAVTDGNGETVINITVNSDGTETQDTNGDDQLQTLAVKIKDVVRATIEEEQRLGGSLRRA